MKLFALIAVVIYLVMSCCTTDKIEMIGYMILANIWAAVLYQK